MPDNHVSFDDSSHLKPAGLFPPNFVWGAASSSAQIEGGSAPDLRGESVWDAFCRKPGAVHENHTPQVACDHFNRYKEDVRIMADMKLKAYRLSIAWPRVLRDGIGAVNASGLDFYDQLVDSLLAQNIEPWVTLFHWDFPLSLYHKGGWLNRDSAEWFAEYTTRVVERLSDRVSKWMTINEPQVYLQLGHIDGTHAPGIKLPMREALLAAHNTLRAHGRCVQVIRAHAKQPATIGWAPVGHISFPISDDPANIEAARTATFAIKKQELWNNTWFSDPVCLGKYPEDGLSLFGTNVPYFPAADMDLIRQPLDFYGVNIYSGTAIKADGTIAPVATAPGRARNSMHWNIAPEALRWGARFLWERYRLPVVVTENGMCNLDWVDVHGRVQDPQRIDYTTRYLRELARAVQDGADVRGYFHWSILDNFEWAEGYRERFGLVHVDYITQRRTPKASAAWYRRVIETNGASIAANVSRATDLVM